MTLEWVGAQPGKREYRRFVGDYVLTQNDIMAQEPFEDRVAFGGWSIDLHPPQGMYAEERLEAYACGRELPYSVPQPVFGERDQSVVRRAQHQRHPWPSAPRG